MITEAKKLKELHKLFKKIAKINSQSFTEGPDCQDNLDYASMQRCIEQSLKANLDSGNPAKAQAFMEELAYLFSFVADGDLPSMRR